jgi:xanthine dehydrogenase accessory factor
MKHSQLNEIIKKKASKTEFAIVTNLENGLSEIYEPGKSLSKEFETHKEQINNYFKLKKNGVIENTEIFVETYIRPIKVIIVGAVHIAQYLVDFAKSLNFEISIIDPRGYFASEQRFPNINIINKWPDEAFKEIETNENTALIALTHDPKIDDPALQHALNKKFYYIGALGSKKTHVNRCKRLKDSGFTDERIQLIHGPIGIKLGGRSAPEIALSIIAQLVSETYKND